jgi:uncharacterized protein (TIGR03067 family)
MRALSLALLSVGLLAAPTLFADHFQRKAVRTEAQHLHGNWKVVSVEGFDNAKAADEMKSVRLDIHGRAIDARWGDNKTATAHFKIDPTATPHTIDIMVTRGPEEVQGKMLHGVYSLDGDTLKIAYRDPGQSRPTSVAAEGEKDVHRVTLKRDAGK